MALAPPGNPPNRAVMDKRTSRFGNWGGIVFALLLIVVGGWYLLRNTFGLDMPPLDGDALWPIIVLAIGIGILLRAVTERPPA
jgi:hypothetical protein